MSRYSPAFVALPLALLPLAAFAGKLQDAGLKDWNSCAWRAQEAVARRHGLAGRGDATAGSLIYSDPRLSQEADDAFDACVKGQSPRRPAARHEPLEGRQRG